MKQSSNAGHRPAKLLPKLIASSLMLCGISFNAQAIEPTPPIIFNEALFEGEGLALALQEGSVNELQIAALVYQDGVLIKRDKLDPASLKVFSLESFPTPHEEFHLKDQASNIARYETLKLDFNDQKDAYSQRLQLTPTPIKHDQAIAILSENSLASQTNKSDEEIGQKGAVIFLLPHKSRVLGELKDGAYAVDYQIVAALNQANEGPKFETRHWQRVLIDNGEPKPLSIQEYSRMTDPVQLASNRLETKELVYIGKFGKENVSIDDTKKFKAQLINIDSGSEGSDEGAERNQTNNESYED